MLRTTALLLIVVMLVASGRLLACGLECLDQLALPAQGSCHQESAPATAIGGDGMHACLPELAEPRVTVAKPASAQHLVTMSLVTPVSTDRLIHAHRRPAATVHTQSESPHPPAPFVLRI